MKNQLETTTSRESDAPDEGDETRQILGGENDARVEGVGVRIHAMVDRVGDVNLAAHAAGVSVSTLRRYMRGDVAAPFAALAGLARRSGMSLDWLATGEGPRESDRLEKPVAPRDLARGDDAERRWSADELATVLAVGAAVGSVGGLSRTAQAALVLRVVAALRALSGGTLPLEHELPEADLTRLAELAKALDRRLKAPCDSRSS